MRSLLICVFVLLGTLAHVQSALDGPFESSNPIPLNGTVVGVSSWSGIPGPEAFLVFDVRDQAGRPQRWASRVAATMPVRRGEQVVVIGFAAKREATLQELLPYSAVPMLAPIAKAHRVLRATEIKRGDGTTLVAPVQ